MAAVRAVCLAAAVVAALGARPAVLPVPGFGEITIPAGTEPADALESFSQLTRRSLGHVFTNGDLGQLLSTLCAELPCTKRSLDPLSLDLQGIGTIKVQPGQAPAEAIDDFLVLARAEGHKVSEEGVAQVMDYFCSAKPCAVPLAPISLEVSGVGTLVVRIGQEVADAVESFAREAWKAGYGMNLQAVASIMDQLCGFKRCNRQARLPPSTLDVAGVGTISVPFGVEPADAVEAFVGQANRAGHNLDYPAVQQIMETLCAQTPCRRVSQPVSLEVTGVGVLQVPVGEEPADAARAFIDGAMRDNVALTNDDAVAIMQKLCSLKRCTRPLDLAPSTLAVENVGTVVLPLGAEPVDVLNEFLDAARSVGHRISAEGAGQIMQRLCGMKACRRPLDVSPMRLNISDIGTLVVPFGVEPADAVTEFVELAQQQGVRISGDNANLIMERLCSMKKCNVPVDVAPVRLNISGVGTLEVPFGTEPVDMVSQFLLEARAAGHRILADGARQIMEAVCQRRACHQPLDASPFRLEVNGVGTLVLPFGEEPAQGLARFVDQVVAAGGTIDAAGASQLMEAICKNVTCFQPIDVSPFVLNITNVGSMVVPFGTEPVVAVDDFLRRALDAGHQVSVEDAGTIMQAVCQRLVCHRPLDVAPFNLEISGIGTLSVPWGVEPAVAVADFLGRALDAGHRIGSSGAETIMTRVCAARTCRRQLDTSPFSLDVPDLNSTLTIEFGEEPSEAVKTFLRRAVYDGYSITVDVAQTIMNAVCANVACRQPLDLKPVELPVAQVGTLVLPFNVVPQVAVRAFGNQHRLSAHAMQQILNGLCGIVFCQAEK